MNSRSSTAVSSVFEGQKPIPTCMIADGSGCELVVADAVMGCSFGCGQCDDQPSRQSCQWSDAKPLRPLRGPSVASPAPWNGPRLARMRACSPRTCGPSGPGSSRSWSCCSSPRSRRWPVPCCSARRSTPPSTATRPRRSCGSACCSSSSPSAPTCCRCWSRGGRWRWRGGWATGSASTWPATRCASTSTGTDATAPACSSSASTATWPRSSSSRRPRCCSCSATRSCSSACWSCPSSSTGAPGCSSSARSPWPPYLLVRLRSVAVPAHDAEREIQSQLYGDLEERLGGLEDLRANGAGAYAVHRLAPPLVPLVARRPARRVPRRQRLRGGRRRRSASARSLTLGVGVVLQREGDPHPRRAARRVPLLADGAPAHRAHRRADARVPEGRRRRPPRRPAARHRADPARGPRRPPPRPARCPSTSTTWRFAYAGDTDVLVDLDLHLRAGHAARRRRAHRQRQVHPRPSPRPALGRHRRQRAPRRRRRARRRHRGPPPPRRGGEPGRGAAPRVAARQPHLPRHRRPPPTTELLDALADVGLGRVGRRPRRRARHRCSTAAPGCRPARPSCSPSPACCSPTPAWWCSTRPPAASTPTPRRASPQAAERALRGRTVVIIAHRLATLDHVDEVLVLERGRVLEHGRRADLAADPTSEFARLLAAVGRRPGGARCDRDRRRGPRPPRPARRAVAWQLARREPVAYAIALASAGWRGTSCRSPPGCS